jgi:hypothetical protein
MLPIEIAEKRGYNEFVHLLEIYSKDKIDGRKLLHKSEEVNLTKALLYRKYKHAMMIYNEQTHPSGASKYELYSSLLDRIDDIEDVRKYYNDYINFDPKSDICPACCKKTVTLKCERCNGKIGYCSTRCEQNAAMYHRYDCDGVSSL